MLRQDDAVPGVEGLSAVFGIGTGAGQGKLDHLALQGLIVDHNYFYHIVSGILKYMVVPFPGELMTRWSNWVP